VTAVATFRLSDLLGTEVTDPAGRHLGLLLDIRCREDRAVSPQVATELVFGEHGWLERLGFRAVQHRAAPWSAVKSMTAEKIVVEWREPS
jgi:hypothetical protein